MSLDVNLLIAMSHQLPFAIWCLILCNALFLITSTFMVLTLQILLFLASDGYRGRVDHEPINYDSSPATPSLFKASLQIISLSSCAIYILQLVVNGIVAYPFLEPLLHFNKKKRVDFSGLLLEDSNHLSKAADADVDVPETHTEESQRDNEDTQVTETPPTNSNSQDEVPPAVDTGSPSAPVSDTGSKSPILPDELQPSDLYAEVKWRFPPGDIMRLASIIFALGEDPTPEHILNATETTVESLFAEGTLDETHVELAWGFIFRDRKIRKFSIFHAAWEHHSDIILTLNKLGRFDASESDEALWGAVSRSEEWLVEKWLCRVSGLWLGDLTYTPLHLAVQRGNMHIMDMLLRHAARPGGHLTRISDSLLRMAIEHRNLDIADMLMDWGAKPSSVFLDEAVIAGHAGIVEAWLKEGATVKDTVCGPMLQTACVNGHLEVVQLLLDYGHDINQKSSSSTLGGNTPLMAAVIGNHPSVVEFLLSRGASLDGTSLFGNALQTAAFWNYLDVARILLENGFDVNAGVSSLPTPQYLALRRGNRDMVTLLLNKRPRKRGTAMVGC
ncbi:ankyrin repeat domain-containing protein [Aspergillus ibericus CBS 121593]|uniref:Ankyrin n=1 Tax=Aspergillus ibericus CBS 121593 TaxID=1448316 RepID=A0A395HA91_9EURO|nr:ankyrin [Aspergillus ibericus CBS 121593]RAL04499.1 ankyrin [Aspergillus ibericus CBS 121593]